MVVLAHVLQGLAFDRELVVRVLRLEAVVSPMRYLQQQRQPGLQLTQRRRTPPAENAGVQSSPCPVTELGVGSAGICNMNAWRARRAFCADCISAVAAFDSSLQISRK